MTVVSSRLEGDRYRYLDAPLAESGIHQHRHLCTGKLGFDYRFRGIGVPESGTAGGSIGTPVGSLFSKFSFAQWSISAPLFEDWCYSHDMPCVDIFH